MQATRFHLVSCSKNILTFYSWNSNLNTNIMPRSLFVRVSNWFTQHLPRNQRHVSPTGGIFFLFLFLSEDKSVQYNREWKGNIGTDALYTFCFLKDTAVPFSIHNCASAPQRQLSAHWEHTPPVRLPTHQPCHFTEGWGTVSFHRVPKREDFSPQELSRALFRLAVVR